MGPAHTWLYWLDDGTDLFTFEAQMRERLHAKRIELENQYVAKRFARTLDSFLFDTHFPEDNPVTDNTQETGTLVSAAYISILAEHSDLETLMETGSLEYDPFGFEMRIGRDPETARLLVEVRCKSAQMLREFDQFAVVHPVVDAEIVNRKTLLRTPTRFESALVERTFDGNPLVSKGWHFELSSQTAPRFTAAAQHSVMLSTPSVETRARTLAPLLIAEASRGLFADASPMEAPAIIAKTSAADTTHLVRELCEALPLITADLMSQKLSETYNSVSASKRILVASEVESAISRAMA